MAGTPRVGGRDDRGQTTQDFAIGISLFLLTALFVFVFVPTIFTPFDPGVAPGSQQQADRIAATMVDEYSIEDRGNWLNSSFETVVGYGSGAGPFDASDLQQRYGTEDFRLINVTLRHANGTAISTVEGAGTGYDGQQAASVSRLVVVPSIEECSPGGSPGMVCKLTVRVW
jgi:hypothetical protein